MEALMILNLVCTVQTTIQEKCLDPGVHGCHKAQVVIQKLELSTTQGEFLSKGLEGLPLQYEHRHHVVQS